MGDKHQTAGRAANGAQPLGDRHGTATDKETIKTGKAVQRSAGPDGPDPTETSPDREGAGPPGKA